jgi:hypothetical protein
MDLAPRCSQSLLVSQRAGRNEGYNASRMPTGNILKLLALARKSLDPHGQPLPHAAIFAAALTRH